MELLAALQSVVDELDHFLDVASVCPQGSMSALLRPVIALLHLLQPLCQAPIDTPSKLATPFCSSSSYTCTSARRGSHDSPPAVDQSVVSASLSLLSYVLDSIFTAIEQDSASERSLAPDESVVRITSELVSVTGPRAPNSSSRSRSGSAVDVRRVLFSDQTSEAPPRTLTSGNSGLEDDLNDALLTLKDLLHSFMREKKVLVIVVCVFS
jgi:hypothetical protein